MGDDVLAVARSAEGQLPTSPHVIPLTPTVAPFCCAQPQPRPRFIGGAILILVLIAHSVYVIKFADPEVALVSETSWHPCGKRLAQEQGADAPPQRAAVPFEEDVFPAHSACQGMVMFGPRDPPQKQQPGNRMASIV